MIALAMISRGKGEEQKLKRALESVLPFIDKAYITLTAAVEELKETEEMIAGLNERFATASGEISISLSYGSFYWEADKAAVDWIEKFLGYKPDMEIGDKLFEFDKAREFNFAQVDKKYDWIVWIDTDDVLLGGQNLRKLALIGKEQNIDAFYFNYIYQAEFDEKGEIKHRLIEHLRERLVKNEGKYKWIAPIHETLIEQVPTRKTDVPDCEVLHMATDDDRKKSLVRNLRNLELAIYRSDGKDPRHIYYLAKAYFDIRTQEATKRAIPLIHQYLEGENKSGWPEERQQAWEYLCELYRRTNEQNNSLKSALNAFTEIGIPSASIFVQMALSSMNKQQFDLALFWVRIAASIPEQKTTLVRNGKDLQGRILEVIYNACLNLGQIDETWAAAVKLREMFPNEKSVTSAYDFIAHLKEQRDVTKKFLELAEYLNQKGEGHKIKPLLQATPAIAESTPFVVELANKVNPPKIWQDNEIAIYCGPGFTNWSPKQLSDPKNSFVGGSEESCIRISQELSKQGWKVTVFADPGVDEGVFDGVNWLPYYKFNKRDEYNMLVIWRQIGFFDQEIKAKKTFLWIHDIPNSLEYNENRLKRITKIIALSKWQREQIANVPEEKFFYSSNGFD